MRCCCDIKPVGEAHPTNSYPHVAAPSHGASMRNTKGDTTSGGLYRWQHETLWLQEWNLDPVIPLDTVCKLSDTIRENLDNASQKSLKQFKGS